MLPLTGERKPYPFLKEVFNDTDAVFSPDGRWVAYTSNESGQSQVYLTPFPDGEESGRSPRTATSSTRGGGRAGAS